MRFAIITHVNHVQKGEQYFGYAPYVREMNIWFQNVDDVIVVAPLAKGLPTDIDLAYQYSKIDFKEVPAFSLTSVIAVLKTVLQLPFLFGIIFKAMQKADHIHLRCPSNIGLLGCFVQILFPHKKKTAKYAGNWDPKSKQPWSYRLQKWILSNTFLTRNMQVLVYGEWPDQSKNILPFFTASYSESEKEPLQDLKVSDTKIRFVFAGTLVDGKNPFYAIQLVQQLKEKGYMVVLDLYGEGKLRAELETYIRQNKLREVVSLYGNQSAAVLKKAYQNSHFVILPSKSEGWPKAIAEGMFWGCVALATAVSCVPYMLGNGERGIVLHQELESDVQLIQTQLDNTKSFIQKRAKAVQWSREFTLEKFELAIPKLF